MSTISDALKKVQKQRGGEPSRVNPPSVNNPRKAAAPMGVDSSARPFPVVWILAAVVGLFLALSIWVTREGRFPSAGLPISTPQVLPPQVITQRVESVGTEPPGVAVQMDGAPGGRQKEPPALPQEPAPPREPLAVPVLSAIFYAPKNPLAIINGESVKVGELVGGWKVLEILAESVRLEGDGGERVIKLK